MSTERKQIWELAMSPRRKGEAPRFVSLEPAAWASDVQYQAFSAAERGTYDMLCWYLYCNNGVVPYDEQMFMGLCKCTKDELHTVLRKFQIRGGMCTHKRVQKELNKARKLMNRASRAAKARWDKELGLTKGHAQAMLEQCLRNAKVSEAKRSEEKKEFVTNTKGFSKAIEGGQIQTLGGLATAYIKEHAGTQAAPKASSSSPSLKVCSSSPRRFAFERELAKKICPKSESDITALRNLNDWIEEGIRTGRFKGGIYDRILAYDLSWAKNTIAALFHRLEDDLEYKPAKIRRRQGDGA